MPGNLVPSPASTLGDGPGVTITVAGHEPEGRTSGSDLDVLPDDELVARFRERDEAAVRVLTGRYNRRLLRVARSILRDEAEAEDVVQETYVRAFASAAKF